VVEVTIERIGALRNHVVAPGRGAA
jgi:hypothetical protein